MKAIVTYILKLNGAEIESHPDKKSAMKSKHLHCNASPCAHWDGGTKAGYEVFRRVETLVWQ